MNICSISFEVSSGEWVAGGICEILPRWDCAAADGKPQPGIECRMCLILVVWRRHPLYPCLIAANRDEFHGRAAEPAHWWPNRPHILAGRDLVAGGTWLGITRGGRFAALTNYRSPQHRRTDVPSRGRLVTDALESSGPPEDDLRRLRAAGPGYNGFNLIFSDGQRLGVYESVPGEGRVLPPGIYGLSNHVLDTPWPKVERAKERLHALLDRTIDPAAVLELLRDERPAPDEDLPGTGMSLEWERLLSSAFIRGSDYGTRCSTVIRIDQSGKACFDEWTWDASGSESSRVSFQFEISNFVAREE